MKSEYLLSTKGIQNEIISDILVDFGDRIEKFIKDHCRILSVETIDYKELGIYETNTMYCYKFCDGNENYDNIYCLIASSEYFAIKDMAFDFIKMWLLQAKTRSKYCKEPLFIEINKALPEFIRID